MKGLVSLGDERSSGETGAGWGARSRREGFFLWGSGAQERMGRGPLTLELSFPVAQKHFCSFSHSTNLD